VAENIELFKWRKMLIELS